jgi:hypothetical protein
LRALPGVVAAAAGADACARNLAALDCAHRRDPTAHPRVCSVGIARGTLVDGAWCVRDSQCAGGLCDRGPRGCGVCSICNPQLGQCEAAAEVPLGTQSAGQPCDHASCDGGEGLVCLGAESQWCVAPQLAPLGGTCADVASGLPVVCAAPNARCDRNTWTCAPRVAIGEPCDTHDDCVTGAACVRSNGRYRCVKESVACR